MPAIMVRGTNIFSENIGPRTIFFRTKIPETVLHLQVLLESEFLQKFDRGIKAVGKCLFRAFSKLLFGTEDWHAQIRQYLVQLVSLNPDKLLLSW